MLNLIFDVDGTLYSFSKTGIGKQMRGRINEFLMKFLGSVSYEEADQFADENYKKYGLTARALAMDKKVDAHDLLAYCSYVHMISFDPMKYNHEMVEAFMKLSELPNVNIWALTNATKQHAAACLAQLGISNAFRCPKDGVLRIIDCFKQWELCNPTPNSAECKPLRSAYDLAERLTRESPDDEFVMCEDALRNLHEPQVMGWRTVYVSDGRADMAATAKAEGHTAVVEEIMDAVPLFFQWAKENADKKAAAKS